MFTDFPIQFENPIWLVLLLLVVPAWLIARKSIGAISTAKAYTSLALRAVVIMLVTLALAEPMWVKRGEGLTVMMLVDVSQSIPLQLKSKSFNFLRSVSEAKEDPEDRIGVVTVARDATITAMPDSLSRVELSEHSGDLAATNLADGMRMAIALFPQDTASRILLVSDGNETEDSVLAAAEIAQANGIPIDVVPVEYAYENEVIFDSVKAPARARVGQSADVRMAVRSQRRVSGRITFLHNGSALDLDPEKPGEAMSVTLEPGPNMFTVPVSLEAGGAHEFRAVFEPDVPGDDAVKLNNEAVAVTYVSGDGRVLVLDASGIESAPIQAALRAAGIEVVSAPPESLIGGLSYLNGFDAVILANVPRASIDADHDLALHSYVHDLGGGLIMLGGDQSFGAGGWIGSNVEKALPLKLDPPQTRQMTSGALALVMHSCEMPQGNYWGQKTAEYAIDALSRLDYCGIVTFNWGLQGGNNGCAWEFPMQRVGDKSGALAATKKMVVGDMPAFDPSLQLAFNGLTQTEAAKAGQKHVIVISDGDPQPPTTALLNQFIAQGITITTVMVAGHGTMIDLNNMKAVAEKTGGTFYNVTNPNKLPQIFIKEATLVSRSLIVEGDNFQPSVVSRLPGPVDTFGSVPPVRGYVLTAPREGLAQIPIIHQTTEGPDPIYAYWNYGLGKGVAYTSDVTGRWGAAWVSWADLANFWERTVRWSMRPATPNNLAIKTRVDGDQAIVELEAIDQESAFLNFAETAARVIRPGGTTETLQVHQVGPGRYRGEFAVEDAGAYLVNVAFASGTGPAASIQAAVSVPYPREYRSIRDNKALLRTLAERTGGRVIAPDDPVLADVFNKADLEVPRSAERIWDLLAILAAAFFVLDVAVRRLSLDPGAVAGGMKKAIKPRSQTETSTVDAWKRARAQASTRRADPAEAAVKFEAKAGDATAVDVSSEVVAGPSMPRPPAASGTPKEGGPVADEGEYTSRLLKAKQRAVEKKDPSADGHAPKEPQGG